MPFRSAIATATFAAFLVIAAAPEYAAAQSRGILGRQAPSWCVDEWLWLPGERDALDVADLRGKVIYLYGFQTWCPGCHARGFPTLKALHERYEGDDDVAFVAIQTTFEGYSANTPEKGRATVRERYDLDIPVAHSGSRDTRSQFMIDYRTGGTPWTVIIDRDGVVRYNDFHIGVEEAAALIQRLRDEPAQEGPTPAGDARENRGVQTLPASRGGQDLVGTQFPTLDFDRWVRSEHGSEQKAEDRVTLYRWWTDGCPFCEASAPAIESLREEYEPKGLRVVAVYHPKPPREVVDEAVLGAAERLGIGGEIAVDQDWSALRELWLSTGRRSATSATFIVDEDGVIRFVHPGPQFFPSDDPALTQQDADYRSIKDAVEILLQRQGQPPPD